MWEICHISLDDMGLVTLNMEIKLPKCIRMGITIFKTLIWEGISSSYIARRLKTKFPTVYSAIYLPKSNFKYSYPLHTCLISTMISLDRNILFYRNFDWECIEMKNRQFTGHYINMYWIIHQNEKGEYMFDKYHYLIFGTLFAVITQSLHMQ